MASTRLLSLCVAQEPFLLKYLNNKCLLYLHPLLFLHLLWAPGSLHSMILFKENQINTKINWFDFSKYGGKCIFFGLLQWIETL